MVNKSIQYNLSTEDIPKKWYNILPDLPVPFPPYKDPDDGSPSRLANLPNLFAAECLKQ